MRKTRILLLFLSFLILLLTVAFVANDKTKQINKKKPNIILILADDIGFETISAYGSTYTCTKNFDQYIQGSFSPDDKSGSHQNTKVKKKKADDDDEG